jgi:hypothetical protein
VKLKQDYMSVPWSEKDKDRQGVEKKTTNRQYNVIGFEVVIF